MREFDLAYHLSRAKKLTDIVAKEEDFVRDMTISTSPSCIGGEHISLLSSLISGIFLCKICPEFE